MKEISYNDRVIIESLVSKYGDAELLNELKIPRKMYPIIAAAGLAIGGTGMTKLSNDNKDIFSDRIEMRDNFKERNPYGMSDRDYDLFLKKVDATRQEIDRVLGYRNMSSDDVEFDIETLVYLCYAYEYDLPLAIAQLRCESHFGTTDRAKRTNSMFSIGAHDNGTDKVNYSSQTESIEPYIKIMQRDFFQNNTRTVDNLLSNGGFYRLYGKKKSRYASDPNYEKTLRSIRNGIIKNYPVLSQEYNYSI